MTAKGDKLRAKVAALGDQAAADKEHRIVALTSWVTSNPRAAAERLVLLVGHNEVLESQCKSHAHREREALGAAAQYRDLWEAAASCLLHNQDKLRRPRGPDEKRLLSLIHLANLGRFWSGETKGLLDWVKEPDNSDQGNPSSPTTAVQGSLFTEANDG